MFDLVITNGTIVDGTGSPSYKADIGINGDTVAAVGKIVEKSRTKIDARGKVVAPGFIDLHTHSDNSFLIDKLADSKLTQGVTYELLGNCGMSYCAPLNANTLDGFKQRTDRYAPEFNPDGSTMHGYLNALEKSG